MNVVVSVGGWVLWGYLIWNSRHAIVRDLGRLPWARFARMRFHPHIGRGRSADGAL